MKHEADVLLWLLRKDCDEGSAVLCEIPEYGWDARLFHNGDFQQSSRSSESERAEAWAEEWREERQAKGWVPLAWLES